MKPLVKVIISIAVLVFLSLAFYFTSNYISSTTGKGIFGWVIKDNQDASVNNLDAFAKCLTEKGAIAYVREGCSYCKQQKEKFGSSLQYLNIVECTTEPTVCLGLEGVPAWHISEKTDLIYGVQSLEKLSELSGCEL